MTATSRPSTARLFDFASHWPWVLLMTLVLGWVGAQKVQADGVAISISGSNGKVERTRAGGQVAASTDAVAPGDRITTAPSGRIALTITCPGGETVASLGSGSALVIRSVDASGVSIELEKGILRWLGPICGSITQAGRVFTGAEGVDMLISGDAAGKSGRISVRKGTVEIAVAERKLVLREMLTREIRAGKVLAALPLEEKTWQQFVGATALAAIPETMPAVSAIDANLAPPGAHVEYIRLDTSMGVIILELDTDRAPLSVTNFLSYTRKGHFDGTIFHRVVRDGLGVVQGGGMGPDMQPKPTDSPINNEWNNGLKNVRGSVAMARRSGANTATSQFYINTRDNMFLDEPRGGAAYAVFGKVVLGMDVVDAMNAVPTETREPHRDVPVENIVLTKAAEVVRDEVVKLLIEEAARRESSKTSQSGQ